MDLNFAYRYFLQTLHRMEECLKSTLHIKLQRLNKYDEFVSMTLKDQVFQHAQDVEMSDDYSEIVIFSSTHPTVSRPVTKKKKI